MTLMTLDQKRALLAFKHVQEVKGASKECHDAYGGMALKLPALIRTAGLCQALHFVRSRGKEPGYMLLLCHLSEQLQRVAPNIKKGDREGESLCEIVRSADLKTYIHLSREAIAALDWYARLAQSELKVDRTVDLDRTAEQR